MLDIKTRLRQVKRARGLATEAVDRIELLEAVLKTAEAALDQAECVIDADVCVEAFNRIQTARKAVRAALEPKT